MQNSKKWIQVGYILVVILTWIFFYNLTDLVWDLAGFPLPVDWFVTPAHIVAFVASIILLVILQRNQKINQYSGEVASELAKVTWPERKETMMSTGVVAIMVAICSMILFGFDSLWGSIVQIIY